VLMPYKIKDCERSSSTTHIRPYTWHLEFWRQYHHDSFELTVSRKQVEGVWKRTQNTRVHSLIDHMDDVSSRKKQCGRKRKYQYEEIVARVKNLPFEKRTNLRSMSAQLEIPLGTLHTMKVKGWLYPHTSIIKPALTEEHKKKRVEFACSEVDPVKGEFSDMEDCIHIDEKWFFLTEEKQKIYLVPGEEKPKRKGKRKKIQKEKAMFLAAVARPRYDPNRKAMWDGKIGIWPFVEKVPAMRNSKNRPKGTLETKQVSVTTEVYVDMLINKLLPAIEAKWPKGTLRKLLIRIQQDNASPHKGKAMEEKA